jgi:hypothetical protein
VQNPPLKKYWQRLVHIALICQQSLPLLIGNPRECQLPNVCLSQLFLSRLQAWHRHPRPLFGDSCPCLLMPLSGINEADGWFGIYDGGGGGSCRVCENQGGGRAVSYAKNSWMGTKPGLIGKQAMTSSFRPLAMTGSLFKYLTSSSSSNLARNSCTGRTSDKGT